METNQFKTGYESIDRNMPVSATDLICIASKPEMGCTMFALNVMQRSCESKGCFISLIDTKQQMKSKIDILSKNESFYNNKDPYQFKEIDFKFLELPTTLELIEFIVSISHDYDYFVIDRLSYINLNLNTNPVFSKNKNYHEIVRHLKSACSLMKKNIILLSTISHEIKDDEEVSFIYYGLREKYFDHIITIARPEWYKVENSYYFGKNYEIGQTVVNVVKTQSGNVGFETYVRFNKNSLEFDSYYLSSE